jgi:hypothetical protein
VAREASDLFTKGYRVIMRINANLLDETDANKGAWRGNHIVTLVSPIDFGNVHTVVEKGGPPNCFRDPPGPRVCYYPPDMTYEDGTLTFKVYTWGKVRNVPYSGTLTVKGFVDSFWGFVAGKY